MSELAACVSCRRHVRVDEARCPFCGATERAGGPTVVVGRTSRARLVAIATSIGAAAVLAGCPRQPNMYGAPPLPPEDAAPAVDAAPSDDETGAASDASASAPIEHPPVALYGAPPAPPK